MYILLTDANTVAEIIPNENPIFPGIPVERRYAPDFVAKLIHVPDDTQVEQNWVYNSETATFREPEPRLPEETGPKSDDDGKQDEEGAAE